MTSTKTVVLPVDPRYAGLRLDAFLTAQLPWRSRQSVVDLIRDGAVTLDGRPAKKARRVAAHDRVVLTVPADGDAEEELAGLALDVLYEDDDLVVVNKPRDLAVHASSTCQVRNLLTRLERRYRIEFPDPSVEPLLVHRLDRTTSGVIAVAKRRELVAFYTRQFELRTTRKSYLAIVEGRLEGSGHIEARLRVLDRRPVEVADDGLEASTHYQGLEATADVSRVAIELHTGRKHQIRVHLASIGHPLVGDHLYGAKLSAMAASGPLLHARALTLHHRDGRELTFEAPLPESLERAWASLRQ